jgi:hypothetical protein
VFIDPVTGAEQGRREWGAVWPITSETFVSFLYVLHYTLHIPEMWGIDRWGIWLLGGVAILWTLDCFVGFYLTLPPRQKPRRAPAPRPAKGFWARWKPAWVIKTSASAYRINFDIHRAFGLWLWGVLFTVAFTAFSLNLYSEVFYPVMSKVSKVTPSPFDLRKPVDHHSPIIATRTYAQVLDDARAEAAGAAGGAGRRGLLLARVRHLRRGLPRARRRPRRGRRRPALPLLRRQDRRPAGRFPAVEGHGGRHLRPGPVPAALGPDPGRSRTDPDLADRRGRGGAQRDRRGHLAEEAQGAGGR